MHKIKEKLMEELYKVEEKMKKASGGSLSAGDLEYVHKLTDTIKNIDKIEMLEDGDYSEATNFMGEGRMYGTSYDGGSSYARGGRGRGRNARRDSMGRYSRDGGMSYDGSSSYDDGISYARGGQGGRGGNQGGRSGNYSRRGGYSYGDAKQEMMECAEEMMDMAENEQQRKAVERFIHQIEQA